MFLHRKTEPSKSLRISSPNNNKPLSPKHEKIISPKSITASKPPQYNFKGMNQQTQENQTKDANSKNKSMTPVRSKEMGEFNEKIISTNSYLNYKASNLQHEVKNQSANVSTKSINEKDSCNKSSTSLNTSGIGTKKTDLNKFINFNK